MAISPMKKVSLIAPKEWIDDLLLSLQSLRHLEIKDLNQDQAWQDAFLNQSVQLPELQLQAGDALVLSGEEVLNHLLKRQQTIEGTINRLRTFLPPEGFFETLRKPRRELTFEQVELANRESLEQDLLHQVKGLFKEHGKLLERMADLEKRQDELLKWKELETTPKALKNFKHIEAVIGTIPNTADNAYFKSLVAQEGLDFQEVYRTDTEYGIILFRHPGAESLDLDQFGFKALDYDYDELPAERLEIWQEELSVTRERQSSIEQQLKEAKISLEVLESELEATTNRHAREIAKKHLAKSQYLVAIEGWIEEASVADLKSNLLAQYGGNVWVETTVIEPDDLDNVPVKLVNHPLVEPFEMITEMYALPKYTEKDPTPYLAPFYFTFFGMMVADLGYGLLMFLLTGLALKFFHFEPSMKRFLKFFNILGVAVSLWGLVYGSFFAYELPIQLISTTNDVMTILVLSVAFGFVTVLTGLYLGGRQKLRVKEYAEAYHSGFAWCLILIGILGLALGNLIPGLAFLAPIGQWLAILNAIGILVVSVIQAKGLSGLGSGLFNLYNISGYVGDLVSFTRLMALGLSGASIGLAFNLIVGLLPGLSRWTIGILLFLLLHAINIFLSLLSAYVHGARLMFVEFFGKFYEGGGRAFNPLKPTEKYFTIKKVHLEDK
ncbi:V-type ATP synthase subunit I [Streptococcus ovuberis]|uniref:V-type ATP synthase subunit I n=1 Tax=Streptococcus ovuberis TaxID=1936207 RepID=A0A7X6MX03_9STRE|nr:V-type ATP synthase subunit I [Streptococcus ovuberis]NKZ19304.1 V-type ATP synthase subunit I [Streptococcus ovuberis]